MTGTIRTSELVQCASFKALGEVQPFKVIVSSNVLLLMVRSGLVINFCYYYYYYYYERGRTVSLRRGRERESNILLLLLLSLLLHIKYDLF